MPDRQAAEPVAADAPRPGAPGGGAAAARADAGATSAGHRPRRAAVGRLLNTRPLRWGFVAAAVGLGCYAVATQWTQVRAALASLGVLPVAGALLAVLAALLAAVQVWRLLLGGLGSPLPVRAGARVLLIGQLGKYLPGAIWPVVAQMELGSAHKVPRHRSASASALAMLVTLLAGLLVAVVTLPFAPGSTSYRWVLLGAPLLLVCLYPRVLNHMLERLLRLARRPALEQPLSGRAVTGAVGWALVSWACYGLQIWLLATRLGAPYEKTALIATGIFAFAWCVGFVVVFAPAGAGVRDVLLVAMLSPTLGVGKATAVALVSRVLLTVGDLVTAAAAAAFTRRPVGGTS
jgi:glycosyltransferase 2 family protein